MRSYGESDVRWRLHCSNRGSEICFTADNTRSRAGSLNSLPAFSAQKSIFFFVIGIAEIYLNQSVGFLLHSYSPRPVCLYAS